MIVSWEYASFHYSPKPASPIFIAVLREKKKEKERLLKENSQKVALSKNPKENIFIGDFK